jgi:hypothetical protein
LPKPLLKTDFAKKLLCQKNELGKKARTKLAKTFAKNLEADFRNLTLSKETQAMKNGLCQMKPLARQNLN